MDGYIICKKGDENWNKCYFVAVDNTVTVYTDDTRRSAMFFFPIKNSSFLLTADWKSTSENQFSISVKTECFELQLVFLEFSSGKKWFDFFTSKSKKMVFGSQNETPVPGPVIGVSIEDICHRENRTIPRLLEDCINYLTLKGLDEIGLFRIPGNVIEINKIKTKFEETGKLEIHSGMDLHNITGLLKNFLMNLPQPIIPSVLNSHASAIVALEAENSENFSENQLKKKMEEEFTFIFRTLKPTHRDSFFLIVRLCRDIIENSENKMNVDSLLSVITPTVKCVPRLLDYAIENFDILISLDYSIDPQNSGESRNKTGTLKRTKNEQNNNEILKLKELGTKILNEISDQILNQPITEKEIQSAFQIIKEYS